MDKMTLGFMRERGGLVLKLYAPGDMVQTAKALLRRIMPGCRLKQKNEKAGLFTFAVDNTSWDPWMRLPSDKDAFTFAMAVAPRLKLLKHGEKEGGALYYFQIGVSKGKAPFLEMQIFEKSPEGFKVYIKPHDSPDKTHIITLLSCFKFRTGGQAMSTGAQQRRHAPQKKPDKVAIRELGEEIVLDVTSGDPNAHPIRWHVLRPRVFAAIKARFVFLAGEDPRDMRRKEETRGGLVYYLVGKKR